MTIKYLREFNKILNEMISMAFTKPKLLLSLFVFSTTAALAQTNLKWETVAPGVWSARAGMPDKFNFYSITGLHPKIEALAAMPSINFPIP